MKINILKPIALIVIIFSILVTPVYAARTAPQFFKKITDIISFNSTSNNDLAVSGRIEHTGYIATSTVNSVETLLASDLAYPTIFYTPNVEAVTLTLPATSTLTTLVATAGSRSSILIYNATSTATKNITIAVGTGMNLIRATTTSDILPGGIGKLTFLRKVNSDIIVMLESAI